MRDEEGRRRFHGAFTGGFSAGFYNTVGSKEGMFYLVVIYESSIEEIYVIIYVVWFSSGWTPQTFTSSRKNRAEVKKQSIYSFLDEEDIKVHSVL